jgi:hypothetical protein
MQTINTAIIGVGTERFPFPLSFCYCKGENLYSDLSPHRLQLWGIDKMKNILAKFRNRNELIEYTTNVYNLLITDSEIEYILDAETGEIIFSIDI